MATSKSDKPASLCVYWSPAARKSLSNTLWRIHQQDPATSVLVCQRLDRALSILKSHPELGTQIPGTPFRRFVIPKTGHSIDYRVLGDDIVISKWQRNTRRRI